MMIVKTKTPTRIDFAGGTLDLYPLYLFMDGGITVNAGLNLYSNVSIETGDDNKINIESIDLDARISYKNIDDMTLEGTTGFIERAVKSYCPSTGINVKTRNTAPKGSGLGASSSLLMALSSALVKLAGDEIDIREIIERGAAIEAAHLGIPTGKQDYYAAMLGGIHILHFDEKGCYPEEITVGPEFKKEIQRSLIVTFTGISHFSGTNNWDMIKKAIDRTGETFDRMLEIKEIAKQTGEAIKKHDLEKIGVLIGNEWECRKRLAPGISNFFIDTAIENARQAGAWGSKLCGAGGGGCMITLTPPEKKKDVMEALLESGIDLLDADLDFNGLVVEVENGSRRPEARGRRPDARCRKSEVGSRRSDL
ncbi:MAG: hypothetical protein K8T10_05360 [Candidatus Eremiobacteraeota bacterium]|nr:hypothetical protein [Candidatus Eremiobacteraeota bacterium]